MDENPTIIRGNIQNFTTKENKDIGPQSKGRKGKGSTPQRSKQHIEKGKKK